MNYRKFFCVLAVLAPFQCYSATSFHNPLKQEIEKLYEGISGFGIHQKEEKNIIAQGGAPTYGEITFESLKRLTDDLKLCKDDVFYDLGSGVGKVVVQVFLDSPIKKAVGIELSITRCDHAKKVLQKLQTKLKDRTLEFHHQNIADASLSDATVVFMCSTCYSDDLMKKMTDKLALVKKGLRVITLKRLPQHTSFKLVKTYTLAMTWSTNASVHVYERI
jgi:precorrin-6B methylase 2